LLSFFQLSCLPVASTFWRYVNSLGINQANALVRLMALMRQRAWQLCDLNDYRVCVDIELIGADDEIQSWESVQACIHAKLDFIIANKWRNPVFDPAGSRATTPIFRLSRWPITSGYETSAAQTMGGLSNFTTT